MRKRLLALFLSLCLVMGMLSTSAFAASDDLTPPVIKSISMSSPGGTVSAGNTLYFNIEVEDESEINDVTLGFSLQSDIGATSNTIYANFVSYDSSTNIAKAELRIKDSVPSGAWVLSYLRIEDYYGNIAHGRDDIDLDSVKFTVASSNILPTTVSIPGTIEVRVRDVHTIRPTVTPTTSVPKWTWTSENSSIAEVYSAGGGTSCNVTGVAPGTTTITGTTQNGLTATCTVTVTDAPMPESGTINKTYNVAVGGSVDIVPVLTPSDATTLYEVSSDNPHVAGIGTTGGHTGIRIEGNNPGTATITVRGANNLLMTTTVRVGSDSDCQHEKKPLPDMRRPVCGQDGQMRLNALPVCMCLQRPRKSLPPVNTTMKIGG